MPSYKLTTNKQDAQLAHLVLSAILRQANPQAIVDLALAELALYDSAGAADYLGISVNTLAYHLWQQQDLSRRLVPDLRVGGGRVFLFTKMTLDDWNASRRQPNRTTRPQRKPPVATGSRGY